MDLHQHLPSYQEADGGAHGKETTSHIICKKSFLLGKGRCKYIEQKGEVSRQRS